MNQKLEANLAILASAAIPNIIYRWNRISRPPSPHILDFSDTEYHLAGQLSPLTVSNSKALKEVGSRSLTTEEWLDSVEAAAYLKVTLGALRNMTSNGQVPFYKFGKRNRYRTEELRTLLLSHKRGVSNGN